VQCSESSDDPAFERLSLEQLEDYIQHRTDAAHRGVAALLARNHSTAYHLGAGQAGQEFHTQTTDRLGLEELDPLVYHVRFNLDRVFGRMDKELISIIDDGIRNGTPYRTIWQTVADTIHRGWGQTILFDSAGTTRRLVDVTPAGNLSWYNKRIRNSLTLSADTYAETLARTSMKQAYTTGHFQRYRKAGMKGWVYISVADERTRPRHLALHGRVFRFGTPEEEEMAKTVMAEHNCQCRPKAWFGDARFDTDPATYADERIRWTTQALSENSTPETAEYLTGILHHAQAE
jgi:SPP1 gp7 family putative phage head morphogenesis protein